MRPSRGHHEVTEGMWWGGGWRQSTASQRPAAGRTRRAAGHRRRPAGPHPPTHRQRAGLVCHAIRTPAPWVRKCRRKGRRSERFTLQRAGRVGGEGGEAGVGRGGRPSRWLLHRLLAAHAQHPAHWPLRGRRQCSALRAPDKGAAFCQKRPALETAARPTPARMPSLPAGHTSTYARTKACWGQGSLTIA